MPSATAHVPSAPATVLLAAATARAAGVRAAVPAEAQRWFMLAVGSLVIAGLLSLAVVLGRLPFLSAHISDPLFFKRCLVVHVDLALLVWFYAFLAGLCRLRSGPTGLAGSSGLLLAVGGVVAMLAGALTRGSQPILANYIPVIDHPLFLGGLVAFFAGAALFLLATLATAARDNAAGLPGDAAVGLQAAAIAFVLAGSTAITTRAALPDGLDAWTRYEFAAWGAGHVLQVANVAAMLSAWLWLARVASGRAVFTARQAGLVFGALLAPHFVMPLLTMRGALDPLYHNGATLLMRWGIFPVALFVAAATGRHLWRCAPDPQPLARLARAGFAASVGLTVLGFVLGACIRSSTTLVPAHYHASLGGVTVSFMAVAYLVCHALAGRGPGAAMLASARRQLSCFGIGQSIFALGFAIGGAYGLGRKAYASEQHVRSVGELTGLAVMGVGGLVATAGGLWFLFLVLRQMRGWTATAFFRAPTIHEQPNQKAAARARAR